MPDPTPRLYEGVFLLSQAAVGVDEANGVALVKQMLDRVNAEIICLGRWDERRLAYTIEGQKRGTFYRTLFKVSGPQIANIERDCNLSEDVLRAMMLRADHMGEEEVNQAIAETNAAAQQAPAAPAAPTPAPTEAPAETAPAAAE